MREIVNRYWQDKADQFDVHYRRPSGLVGTLVSTLLTRRMEYLLAEVPLSGNERVLDIGCGSGQALDSFARKAEFAVGLDFSSMMLELGRSRLEEWGTPNAALVRGQAEVLALRSEAFDAVFALGLLDYIENLRPLLAEVARVLRRGGLFAFSCPRTLSPYALFRTRWGNYLRSKWFNLPPILCTVSRRQMNRLLEESGLRLLRSTHILATMWIFIAEKQ
jgi:ubiquinone/menaquinone biosynthesis C-methylase UbiE